MWHLGQKIVCVNDTYRDAGWSRVPHRPVKGQVYTIRAIHPDWFEEPDGNPDFLLEEIVNPTDVWVLGNGDLVVDEIHFGSIRFRPVKTTKTDISAFTKLLKTKELEHV